MKLQKIRKMVIDPFDGLPAMQAQSLLSKRIGRLDGNDPMAEHRERCGVASRPRPDVKDPRGRRRKQMHHLMMDIGKRDALVLFRQCRRVVAVPLRSLDHHVFSNPAGVMSGWQ
ncbi:hypothetical protein [Azospirillum largimobile]